MLSSKVILLAYILMLVTQKVLSAERETLTSERKIKEQPIVIHTQQKIYQQPTLQEYQQCHANRDQCLNVCETTVDPHLCITECPVCPLLLNHDIVVQGVNDTDYRLQSHFPLNSTNVIKLTNEIRNVIETNMSNITAINENNIHIDSSNASTTGGSFGLGYNQNGACCIVVRPTQRCQPSSVASCRQKRIRVCGKQCKARIMHAKPKRHCNNGKQTNCFTGINYEPSDNHQTSRCHYQPTWPFVSCSYKTLFVVCLRCLRLPYGYILYNGIPPQCIPCFQKPDIYASLDRNMYGYVTNTNFDDFGPNGLENDWRITKKKCRLFDGSIVDCLEDDVPSENEHQRFGDENDSGIITPNTEDIEDNNLNYNGMERRRRHNRPVFYRSSYSHRNKPKF
ncbi:uncharacterized protein LOC128861357 [Anastrepha ludens]|uniref:uncharacterized protein LOC128861357 n=1 Tax=Anastrepha ludens TaxID=28586 RepID=UPI0023AEDC83|nr:uncharacterized protein LOC128861357 [Anastrepha ludens]